MERLLKILFGEYLPLVLHILQNTLVFMVILLCIYVVKRLVTYLFSEDEFVSILIHIVDVYAALLGLAGLSIWTSLDMYFLLRQQRLRGDK